MDGAQRAPCRTVLSGTAAHVAASGACMASEVGARSRGVFPQVHRPGEQAQSDFTDMRELAIRIAGEPFAHLLYHFVLTHSNWEAVMICPSESFESCVRFLRRIPKQRADLATRYARGPRFVWP